MNVLEVTLILIFLCSMTLEDLKEANKGYIYYLEGFGGKRAVKRYIKHLEELVAKAPNIGDVIEGEIVEIS